MNLNDYFYITISVISMDPVQVNIISSSTEPSVCFNNDPPATVLFPLDFRPMITRADIVTSTTETPEAAVPSTPAQRYFLQTSTQS